MLKNNEAVNIKLLLVYSIVFTFVPQKFKIT